MGDITFASLTIPTPQPYDDKDEHRQRENFYYVLNQIFQEAQAQNMTLADVMGQGTLANLTELTQAVRDLADLNVVIDRGTHRIEIFGRFKEST